MKCKVKEELFDQVNRCLEEYSQEFNVKEDINALDMLLENYSGSSLSAYDYEKLLVIDEAIKDKYDISRILTFLNRYYGPLSQGNINVFFNKSKRLLSTLEFDRIAIILKVAMDNKMIDKLSEGLEIG